MAKATAGVDISVVIPCRNGADVLGTQLDALLAQQTAATFEVIVADNGSVDGTAAIVRSYAHRDPRVRLVDASRAVGANAARNDGIGAARGPAILLTDADDVVQPGWLEAYRRAFDSGAQAVGGGLNRVLADGTVLKRERKLYRSQIGRFHFANGTNCGFTVEAYRRVGGFDESFREGADEVEFFWRMDTAGYRLQLVDTAVVVKAQRTDLDEAFRQYFHYGRGEMRMVHKFKPGLVAPIVVFGLVPVAVSVGRWMTVARLTSAAHRESTCALAWQLGMLCEGIQLRSGPRRARGVSGKFG